MMACSCGGARSLAVPRALTAGDDPRYPSLENLIDPRTVRGRANLSVSVSGGTKTIHFCVILRRTRGLVWCTDDRGLYCNHVSDGQGAWLTWLLKVGEAGRVS